MVPEGPQRAGFGRLCDDQRGEHAHWLIGQLIAEQRGRRELGLGWRCRVG